MHYCAACGLPAHRYDTSDPDRHDKQECINMLLDVIARLQRSDLYVEGWNDAIRVAFGAWQYDRT